jgi:hypothetical protein
MRVNELIDELFKLKADAQVYIEQSPSTKGKISFALKVDNSDEHLCVIRDYVMEHRKEIVTIHGQEFDVIRGRF